MQPQRKPMDVLSRFMRWRLRIINSIESLDGKDSDPVPEEKAIVYAVWAIAGLLFLGAVWIGCLFWMY